MKNEPFGIFLTVLLVEKKITREISLKCGPFDVFLSVLIVKRKIFSTFFLNYEPNAIFLYSLIVERQKNIRRKRTIHLKSVQLNGRNNFI